ncbi:MAG: hypothetical protein DME76_01900 [Verrucomicrobia bacterium]|nr:MAG: hypothetical protein DME76_01900 [Verrucomicrobiota bacterium]
MTIFLGCGFAAKYREGGGNFSVPLQWMLGLRRLKLDAIWLELLPASGDVSADEARIKNFQRQLRAHGLAGRYCLLYQKSASGAHDLDSMRCIGISKREFLERLGGPNVLLNLAYSIHPPLLLKFEQRTFCDLDPSEIFYWMTQMEIGQSYHHEFWTIGLNTHGDDCQLPRLATVAASLGEARDLKSPIDPDLASHRDAATEGRPNWKTFYPLVDTELFLPRPRSRAAKFTTVGQWYWGGAVEVAGEFPDLSKKFAFEPYLNLPARVPKAQFELAMNIAATDPERERLRRLGWKIVDPHRVARTPRAYRRYLASALAEFTAIKGVDVAWRTGWVSDRAAAFLALGRPVITEDTGAQSYLPAKNGFRFVQDATEAEAAVREVLHDWSALSKQARETAVEVFDSAKNLRNILNL